MSEKDYLTAAEAGRILNKSQTVISYWCANGKIRGAKKGFRGTWLIPNDITMFEKIKEEASQQLPPNIAPSISGKISVRHASERWGVTDSFIYNAIHDGKILGATRIGKYTYVQDLEILTYVESEVPYTNVRGKAKELSISEKSVWKMCKSGQLVGAYKRGKIWLIPINATPPAVHLERSQKIGKAEQFKEREIWHPNKKTQSYRDYVFGQDDVDNINSIHPRIIHIMHEKFGPSFSLTKLCEIIKKQTGEGMGKIDLSYFTRIKNPTSQYHHMTVTTLYRIANALDCSLSDLLPTRNDWQKQEKLCTEECQPDNYVSARKVASLWGISQRRVAVLCKQGRVPGAKIVGNMWLIPENIDKPEDPRRISK